MALFEVKDVVREHLGRTQFPSTMLDLALQGGRREIEKAGNFWWMRSRYTKATVATQSSYSIKTSTTNGFNIPNFKDIKALYYKKTTENSWQPLSIGPYRVEDIELSYNTDDTNEPEAAVVDNNDLIFFPIPNAIYDLRLFVWEWTLNPTSNTGSDDLTDHFPEALIYGALTWAYEMVLKDLQGASYWRALLLGPPDTQGRRGNGGEIAKIKALDLERAWHDEVILIPRAGPVGNSYRRRLDRLQIYCR